jgi:hypothetical protein
MAVHRGAVIMGLAGALLAGGLVGIVCYREKRAREPFDADKYLASGMVDAKAEARNVRLASIEASFVSPDGRVHTEHGGSLSIFWVGSGDDATAPAVPGAPHRAGKSCTDVFLNVHLYEDSDGVSLRDSIDSNRNVGCWKVTAPGSPNCTIAGIWKRAIAKGAPNPGFATIKLETTRAKSIVKRTWQFRIVDRVTDGPDRTIFSADFADDC